jgi:uncharacterized protein YsxB (DUF464 family)
VKNNERAQVVLFWGKEGLVGLESRGHAGVSPKGKNVVCAAVSTLAEALLVGLGEVAGLEAEELEVDASIPLIRVKWAEDRAGDLDLLTRTVALSLRKIASGYPGQVSVSEVYVS